MRIVLAGTVSGRGGVQTHLRWLARALVAAEHEVMVLSLGSDPGLLEDAARIAHGMAPASVCFVNHSRFGRSAGGHFLAAVNVLRHFRPEVYLACGTGWNLFAPAIASRPRPRLIFHEVMSGEAGNWRDSRWLVRWFFDDVVAQAAPVGRNFARTFHWPRQVPVLPAFPEPLEMTASIPPAVPRRCAAGTVRAGFFGRLVAHKRAGWLVEQWPRLSRTIGELHLFGSGPEESQIRMMISERGWSERVFCHGAYPTGQAYVDLLGELDMTLLPTVGAEGAPLVLLESMACGVPFVATDAGGISDYANPDCLLASWKRPDKFLEAVETLAGRLAGGDVDQRRLQRLYQTNFSFVSLGQRWRDYLDSLAVRPAARK